MRSWRIVFLVFELFLFALILVLPQVELPDFVFRVRQTTAPVLAKADVSPAPFAYGIATASLQSPLFRPMDEVKPRQAAPPGRGNTHSLLALLCTLLS
jgi:hypothetical protein